MAEYSANAIIQDIYIKQSKNIGRIYFVAITIFATFVPR